MSDAMSIRCPFCDFDRSQPPETEHHLIEADSGWRAVPSMRELAVHLVYKHPSEWDELVQTAGTDAGDKGRGSTR